MARHAGAVSLLVLVLAGCLNSNTLSQSVHLVNGTLSPLPPDKVALVRVSEGAAASTVLAQERETGWPDEDIAWRDGGCVLIAWFQPEPMSFNPDPGPPYAVYLVRLVDLAATGRVTWVMVNAETGELDAALSGQFPFECATLRERIGIA
jgi:pimeloyl-ACP methyl ester carboxylesterase